MKKQKKGKEEWEGKTEHSWEKGSRIRVGNTSELRTGSRKVMNDGGKWQYRRIMDDREET